MASGLVLVIGALAWGVIFLSHEITRLKAKIEELEKLIGREDLDSTDAEFRLRAMETRMARIEAQNEIIINTLKDLKK